MCCNSSVLVPALEGKYEKCFICASLWYGYCGTRAVRGSFIPLGIPFLFQGSHVSWAAALAFCSECFACVGLTAIRSLPEHRWLSLARLDMRAVPHTRRTVSPPTPEQVLGCPGEGYALSVRVGCEGGTSRLQHGLRSHIVGPLSSLNNII